MASKQFIVSSEWQPDKRQTALIQRYAQGHAWHRAALLEDIPVSTYQRWLADHPEMREMGDRARTEAIATIAERQRVLASKCYDILDRVGDGPGDLPPGHALVRWAERQIRVSVLPLLLARGFAAAGLDGQRAARLIEQATADQRA